MRIKNIILWLSIVGLAVSCKDNDFENKFNDNPSKRVQKEIVKYQRILTDAPYGWKMTYSMGADVEYLSYQIAYFNKDLTVKLHSPNPQLPKPIESAYSIKHEADVELVFDVFNENLTIFSYPSVNAPKGYGGDVEFNFKSVDESKGIIVLEGKVYGGILTLEKAKEEFKDFAKLKEYIAYLGKQRTARYMNLAITEGLDGASEKTPVLMGLDLSSMARVGDYAYNYKGKFKQGRKMLYFTHEGMGLSTAIEIGGHKVQYFTYNKKKFRYELANSDLKGYLYCSDLPVYSVPKVVDEFLDHYSLWMKASFGQMNAKYTQMKRANPKISTVVFVTDYKRRIPLFNEKGEPILDASYNHDYEFGEYLGNGLIFSFESYNQFYFYFVPLEVEKLSGDRLRFKRKEGDVCKPKDGEDATAIAKSISESQAFNDFVSYVCNEKGWYIKRTIESGQIDWDFISQANPKEDYFYTRLK